MVIMTKAENNVTSPILFIDKAFTADLIASILQDQCPINKKELIPIASHPSIHNTILPPITKIDIPDTKNE
jgi:hypothetical protein